MPSDKKTTMDVYERFPKNWKTLGVRWPNRHGVTAPLPAKLLQKDQRSREDQSDKKVGER